MWMWTQQIRSPKHTNSCIYSLYPRKEQSCYIRTEIDLNAWNLQAVNSTEWHSITCLILEIGGFAVSVFHGAVCNPHGFNVVPRSCKRIIELGLANGDNSCWRDLWSGFCLEQCFSNFCIFFCYWRFYLCICQRERERESTSRGSCRQREREKQAPWEPDPGLHLRIMTWADA